MSNKKVQVLINGELVNGVEVGFKELEERWNEYQLKDGSLFRMKLVLTQIVRTEKYRKDNDPVYFIASQNVLMMKVPDKLKKKEK